MAEGSGTPLQEFLVKLGYDLGDQRKFHEALKRGERSALDFGSKVGKIGVVISGLGLAAAKGTLAYAKSLEQLNFVAQRTGTTLAKLRAMQLTGASLGSSAAGAQASIEGFASFMRRNPGAPAFLKSFGINTTDTNGKQLDTSTIFEEMAQSFRKMPVWRAEQYASMLGISENMMLAMRNPSFDAKFRAYESAEGKGVDKAGTNAHSLMNQDRLLGAHQFGMAAQAMTPAMSALTQTLKKTNEELQKLQGTDSLLNNAMRALAGLNAVGVTPERVAAAGGAWWAARKLLGKGGAAAGKAAAGEAAAAGIGLGPLAVGAGLMTYSPDLNQGESSELAMRRKSLPARQQYAVWRLMRMGLTEAQAIGMAANFTAESAIDPRAVGDGGKAYGIAQWHPDRQAQFKKLFGHDIRTSSLDEQLRFSDWELTHRYTGVFKKMQEAGSDVRLQARIVSRGYERPADAAGQAAARASIAQNINTTINVNGSSDPVQTARRVAQEQKHVNQQLSRNTAGAFR